MANSVVHFEIHAGDAERAIGFYGAVFDWELPLWMEEPRYWGIVTAPQGSVDQGSTAVRCSVVGRVRRSARW